MGARGIGCHSVMHAPAATRVIELDPRRDGRWAAFVNSRRDALVYQHPAWLRVLEQTYGGEPIVFACEEPDGSLSGILPLFYTRGILTGCRLSSLPHTPVAGPLADGGDSTALLLDAAVSWAKA